MILKNLLFIYVWVFCMHTYLCILYMPSECRSQKKVLNSLELELQMVVNQLVGAGNQTSRIATSALYH